MINVAPILAARVTMLDALPPLLVQLKDTSLPLDERWDAYTQLVNNDILVREMTYGDGFLDVLDKNGSMYDDFNTDRGQTLTFPDMYQMVMDGDEWNESLVAMQPNLPAWQEKVLASGYSSFTYDW